MGMYVIQAYVCSSKGGCKIVSHVCICVCRHSSEGGSKKVALKLSVPEAKVVASSLEEMEDGEDSKREKRLQQVKEERINRLDLARFKKITKC